MPLALGWIPDHERTPEMKTAYAEAVAEMPDFRLVGSSTVGQKYCLWDCVKVVRKRHLPIIWQQVGSCAGHGKMKAEWYLMYVERVRLGQAEEPIMPYEPYGYAQGRVCAGIRIKGDGGTGAGCAKAARLYGVLRSDYKGLPPFKSNDNVVVFPGNVDRSWGQAGSPVQYHAEGKQHLVLSTSLARSADDVARALQNYYPVTVASDWGGHERVPIRGTKHPILLNKHVTEWMHMQMVSGWWDHPEFGEIFHIDNSWEPGLHGDNPDDAPPGGYWVLKADMEYMVRQRDSYIYSQFQGYPAQGEEIDMALFDLIGKRD